MVGKKDLFTRFYRKKEKMWKVYAPNIEKICCIDTASHYFQSDFSDVVAQYIVPEI